MQKNSLLNPKTFNFIQFLKQPKVTYLCDNFLAHKISTHSFFLGVEFVRDERAQDYSRQRPYGLLLWRGHRADVVRPIISRRLYRLFQEVVLQMARPRRFALRLRSAFSNHYDFRLGRHGLSATRQQKVGGDYKSVKIEGRRFLGLNICPRTICKKV